MYSILLIAAILSLSAAAPQIGVPVDALAYAVDEYNDFNGVSPWKWGFRTSNGISREENGLITDEGTDDEAIEVQGSYSFTAPDGVTYTVRYRAGRDGYQAFTDRVPAVGVGIGRPTESVVVNSPSGRQVLPIRPLVGK